MNGMYVIIEEYIKSTLHKAGTFTERPLQMAALDARPGSSPSMASTGVRLLAEDMDRLRVAAEDEGVATATIIRRAVVSELNRIEKRAKRAGKAE